MDEEKRKKFTTNKGDKSNPNNSNLPRSGPPGGGSGRVSYRKALKRAIALQQFIDKKKSEELTIIIAADGSGEEIIEKIKKK